MAKLAQEVIDEWQRRIGQKVNRELAELSLVSMEPGDKIVFTVEAGIDKDARFKGDLITLDNVVWL